MSEIEIPKGWETKKLGEIANIFRGASPRPIEDPRWFNRNSNVGWVRISDVTKSHKFLFNTIQNLSEEGIKKSRFVSKNNLIMSICATVGRPIITRKDVCIHDGFVIFDKLNQDQEYVYYYLTDLEKEWSKEGQTGSQMNLNTTIINEQKINLPKSLDEQKAIAKVLSNTDELIQSLKQLISKKKIVKEGLMQQLLTGKKRLEGFSDEWEIVDIGSLCKTFTKQTGFDYSTHIKPKLLNKYKEGTISFIQNKDFNAKFTNFDTDYYIPKDLAVKFPNIFLNERCLLISISGSIGKVGIFSNSQLAFIGGAVAVGKFKDTRQLDWVMYYLLSELGQNMLLGKVKAGSHQNLILSDIREMKIPLPSLEEQKAITSIFSTLDDEIQVLEQKLNKYQKIKNGMMQQLLTGKIRLI